MRGSITIGRIKGIQIEVNASWLIIFGLVTFMLATSFFPQNYPDWPPMLYWLIGALMAVSLFASVLLHELSHSLVAINHGIEVKRITLFIFGGVAQIETEPDDPKKELKIAIAGPAMSLFLSLLFSALAALAETSGVSEYVIVPLTYLATVNLVLALFNMVPAFPLDGGRVLRALIWYVKGDLKLATRISSGMGGFFGYFLMFSGIFIAFSGDLVGGLWFVFIGWFINQASQASYQQTLVNDIFKKIKIKEFMTKDVIVVDYHRTIQEVVDHYFYVHKFASFPVRRMDEIIGIVTINDIRAVQKELWADTLVTEITKPMTDDYEISPDATVISSMKQLSKNGVGRVLVMENDQLLGIVSNTDILNYIRIHSELK